MFLKSRVLYTVRILLKLFILNKLYWINVATEWEFLGHLVGNWRFPTKLKKSSYFDNCCPNRKKEVRSFQGSINFPSKFIPNFTVKSAVFSHLTRKYSQNKIALSEDYNTSFNQLESNLITVQVMGNPYFTQVFVLRTNANKRELGWCNYRMGSVIVCIFR